MDDPSQLGYSRRGKPNYTLGHGNVKAEIFSMIKMALAILYLTQPLHQSCHSFGNDIFELERFLHRERHTEIENHAV
jgi:hypothetical protein